MATNEAAMTSEISLDSVRYYTSLKDFLDEHCDGESPYLDPYLGQTLPVFSAAMVTSPGMTIAEGCGFLRLPKKSAIFSVRNVSPPKSRISMDFMQGWKLSPEKFLHAFHRRIGDLESAAVRKFFRENAATCIETMWSKVLGVDDQLHGLEAINDTLRTVAVPDATGSDAQAEWEITNDDFDAVDATGSDAQAGWEITNDDFDAVDILTGNSGVLVDVIHSKASRTIEAHGCSLTIELSDQISFATMPGCEGTVFIMHPTRFPGLLISMSHLSRIGFWASVYDFEDGDRWLDGHVGRMSDSQEKALDKLFADCQLPQVQKEGCDVKKLSGFIAAFNASRDEITEAMLKVGADASVRSTIWRAVTGEDVGRSHLERKYGEAVQRSADEDKWTPGTKFTGESFFDRESPSEA